MLRDKRHEETSLTSAEEAVYFKQWEQILWRDQGSAWGWKGIQEVYIGGLGNEWRSETQLQGATGQSAISTISWSRLTRQDHYIFRNCLVPVVRMPVIVGNGVRQWQWGEGEEKALEFQHRAEDFSKPQRNRNSPLWQSLLWVCDLFTTFCLIGLVNGLSTELSLWKFILFYLRQCFSV